MENVPITVLRAKESGSPKKEEVVLMAETIRYYHDEETDICTCTAKIGMTTYECRLTLVESLHPRKYLMTKHWTEVNTNDYEVALATLNQTYKDCDLSDIGLCDGELTAQHLSKFKFEKVARRSGDYRSEYRYSIEVTARAFINNFSFDVFASVSAYHEYESIPQNGDMIAQLNIAGWYILQPEKITYGEWLDNGWGIVRAFKWYRGGSEQTEWLAAGKVMGNDTIMYRDPLTSLSAHRLKDKTLQTVADHYDTWQERQVVLDNLALVLEAEIALQQSNANKAIQGLREEFETRNGGLLTDVETLQAQYETAKANTIAAFRATFLADPENTRKTQRGLYLQQRRAVVYDAKDLPDILVYLQEHKPEHLKTTIKKRDFDKAVLSTGNPFVVPDVSIETKTTVTLKIDELKAHLEGQDNG